MIRNIHLGAKVMNDAGDNLGEVRYLVADPQTDQVTHLVVQIDEGDTRLVVLDAGAVRDVSDNGRLVGVDLTEQQMHDLPDFIERDYVTTQRPTSTTGDIPLPAEAPPFLYPMTLSPADGTFMPTPTGPVPHPNPPAPLYDPVVAGHPPGPIGAPFEEKMNVPENSLIIRKGAEVAALDGKVGKVEDVQFDPNTGRIVSFTVEKGFIFTESVTIPIDLVASADENLICLNVNKATVKNSRSAQSPNQDETSNYTQGSL